MSNNSRNSPPGRLLVARGKEGSRNFADPLSFANFDFFLTTVLGKLGPTLRDRDYMLLSWLDVVDIYTEDCELIC